MRYVTLGLAFALSAISAFGAERWTKFQDPSENFTVEFPSLPRARTGDSARTPGSVTSFAYYIGTETNSMTVFDNLYSSRGAAGDQASTDRILNIFATNIIGAAARIGGKVQSDMPDTLDGQSGRRISILQATGAVYTYRMFYIDGHAIGVAAVVPPGARPAQAADANRFLLSLHLTPHRPN